MRGGPRRRRRRSWISLALNPGYGLSELNPLSISPPSPRVLKCRGSPGLRGTAPDNREAWYDAATAWFAGGDGLGGLGGDAGGGAAGAATCGRPARGTEHAPRRLQRPAGAQRLSADHPEAGRPLYSVCRPSRRLARCSKVLELVNWAGRVQRLLDR